MANDLDETVGPFSDEGQDTRVIAKKLPVTIGTGSKVFDVIWWFLPPLIGGLIWMLIKVHAKNYFRQLEQKIQHDASQIDNYLEQRVRVLQNCAKLLDRAIDLDRSTMEKIAAYRSHVGAEGDEERIRYAADVASLARSVSVAVENYPELKAHREIEEAMRQNTYLQQEITAARELYNDTITVWNQEIFHWPSRQIVAAQAGYTTRLPFIADQETREAAKQVFF